jgi:hypothetical protein
MWVLLCVPSLNRAVEHSPINRDTSGFKFSKTLELPHKKAGSQLVVAIRTEPLTLDAGLAEWPLPVDVSSTPDRLVGHARSSRAPPPAAL